VPAYRAEWVLPIASAPMRDAWVAVAQGRIVACGERPPAQSVDLGRVALLPALVNAHTHIELSYLRGRVPPAPRFVDWVRRLLAERRETPQPDAIVTAARAAVSEARAAGTGLIGDVCNALECVSVFEEAEMPARLFHELLGFRGGDAAGQVRAARHAADAAGGLIALAPHAPYSVSVELFQAVRGDLDARGDRVTSVHLGESPEEVEFLRTGTGPLRGLLEDLGAWNADWTPPGVSPVAYLDGLRFLDERVLAVHGVRFDGRDLDRIAALGVTVVSCPRSNTHVGAGAPPVSAFYEHGVAVAFGTDSLASVPDLNIFSELAEARRLAPDAPASRLLRSATWEGARALGFGRELGTLEAGKRASIIAVALPADVIDVEEYLVSGVTPDAISWLDAGAGAPTDETSPAG